MHMAKRKKNYKPLVVLTLLAVAALASAAVVFTNVTYWLVNATRPPAMKYAGADTGIAQGMYVRVSYYYDSANALNITRISVVGFTGDPTNYTNVIRVCNYYGTVPVTAKLIYRGMVSGPHSSYIRGFYVYWTGPTTSPNGVGFIGTTTYPQSGTVTLNPGQCANVGVHIRIDPATPATIANGKTVLATYQVNIQFEMS